MTVINNNNDNLAYAQSETSRPTVTMNCSPVDDGSGAVDVNINIENLDANSQYDYLFNRSSDASQEWTGSLPSQVQQYTTTIRVPAPVPPDEQFLFQLERITDDGREFAAGKVIRCDQIPPNSSIDSAIDSAGNTIGNTSVTTSDSITFEFSSPDSDVSGFECFLSTTDDNLAEDCTSPKTYSNLGIGEYQFTVIATDIAGNRDPTGPVFVWTIRSGSAASDLDRDGIRNEVDPDDNDPTNDSFETPSGTSGTLIRSEPNQNLTVTANNEGGVTISVFFGGPVHVEACDGQEIHDLAAGESIDIVCGSITVSVNEGDVKLILHGDDGTSLTVDVQEGYEVTFEPQDNTLTTPSSNPGPVTAIGETGEEITVSPGDSVTVNPPPPPTPTATEAVEELISDIQNLEGVSQGIKTSLTAPLQGVVNILNDDNPNNNDSACGRLGAFINQVNAAERRGSLTSAQTDDLRTQAEDIRDMIGC